MEPAARNAQPAASTTPHLSQSDSVKSNKIADVVSRYMEYCHEVSTSGKKETYLTPPQGIIAPNCERHFNGKLYERTRDDFVALLENFFATNGPWIIKVKEQKIDPETNNVDMQLTVKVGGVSHTETLRLHLNDELKIDKIVANMKPKATLEVGLDEYLPSPAPQLDPNNFKEFFNFTFEEREAFRQKALQYFADRFGIDDSQAVYNQENGITTGSYFQILPIKCGGSYGITKSRDEQIPAEVNGKKTLIQIAEFVLVFTPESKNKTYGGSYADEAAAEKATPIVIDQNHSLSFGMYRLLLGDGTHYDIAMQSTNPNHPKEGYVLVKLALQSKEFGEGEGAFAAKMDMKEPSKDGLFKAYVKGSWHFPDLLKSKKT